MLGLFFYTFIRFWYWKWERNSTDLDRALEIEKFKIAKTGIFSKVEVFPGKPNTMMTLISCFCSSHTFPITDDPKHSSQL